VFTVFRRRYRGIFYFRQKKECDFIIRDRVSVISAIQVFSKLTPDNKTREIQIRKQISGVPESFIAADNIEAGSGNKVPFWFFEFLF